MRQAMGRWRTMVSGWMVLATVLVVTSSVGALLAFGLPGVPGFGAGDRTRPATAADTARAFFDAVQEGRCAEMTRLTWFPVGIEEQREGARTTCEQNSGSFADVELGKPAAGAKSQAPFDVSSYLVVPATVRLLSGEERRMALQLVQVGGRWYVTG